MSSYFCIVHGIKIAYLIPARRVETTPNKKQTMNAMSKWVVGTLHILARLYNLTCIFMA